MLYFELPCGLSTEDRANSYVPYGAMSPYSMQSAPSGATHPSLLPTGVPSGPPYGGAPLVSSAPAASSAAQVPTTVQSPYYSAGYMRRFIGRDVRVEFLVGSSGPLVDRIGTLLEVGASYIVLRPIRSNDTLMCDLYSIKFFTVYG